MHTDGHVDAKENNKSLDSQGAAVAGEGCDRGPQILGPTWVMSPAHHVDVLRQ